MKAKPILLNGEMVRAIMNGRKTQTRRVLKSPAWDIDREFNDDGWPLACDYKDGRWYPVKCPYAQPGDLLWARETFCSIKNDKTYYKADNAIIGCHKWKPSIHMPRCASRITLEITDIRVERLQDISEKDAIAEGVTDPSAGTDYQAPPDCDYKSGPVTWFAMLWSRISGIESWRQNPWVWVIEFKPHIMNVDDYLKGISHD